MPLLLSLLMFGCVNDPKPQDDDDCVAFFDKCEAGCEPLCGTTYDRDDVNSGETCDLGCEDSDLDSVACVLVEDTCQWAE